MLVLLLGLVLPSMVFSLTGKVVRNDSLENDHASMATTAPFAENNKVSVLMEDGVIAVMDLDDYLTAVVLREMPASFDMEALKAQAVVARTYTLRRSTGESKHSGAAVCTDSACCQGYIDPEKYVTSGGNVTLVNKVRQAVTDTTKQVLLYNGKLIDATYFSCSGGMTEGALAVWGADIPYLQPTASPGEEKASHYVDTVKFKTNEFLRKLGIDVSENQSLVISDITHTDGGGVDNISICGKVFEGTQLRKKLDLNSTAFTITVIGDSVTITTRGHGHRVGMSQYGAEAMAVQGSDYTQILAHYYKDTEVVIYEH